MSATKIASPERWSDQALAMVLADLKRLAKGGAS